MRADALFLFAAYIPVCLAQTTHPQTIQEIHARLLTNVSSYSRAGQEFEVRVGGPIQFGTPTLLHPGTVLRGKVSVAHGVGLGVRRDRAVVQLEFERCVVPGHLVATCSIQLVAVENSRETVAKANRISGILAASNPNSLFQGLWFKPLGLMGSRSPAGLTGPIGALQSRIAPHPIGAAITVASRLLFFTLPNPEIEMPRGTEVILRVTAADFGAEALLPSFHRIPLSALLTSDQDATFRDLPVGIKAANGTPVADRINFAFLGSRDEVERAFLSAGWTTADPLTRKSFRKSYEAFTALRCYARAPVSPLYYQQSLPDMVFQKTFNSMAKRHHIRIWALPAKDGGDPVWLGAATHDVAIVFDWNKLALTHKIDGYLDRERSKVLNDLDASGCIEKLSMVNRPRMAGDSTDGDLAVADLKPCDPNSSEVPVVAMQRPKCPMPARIARRFVLETRHYFTRGSAYYWAYRGVRSVVTGLRGIGRIPTNAPPSPTVYGLR